MCLEGLVGDYLVLAVNGARDEVELDVRVLDAGTRADEPTAFELVAGAY
jgi:hypothetical protein